MFFFFKQKTAYELRISDWSSDVCSSDLLDYLYVLTVADINATNPTLWNSWRASLLRQLYTETKRALKRGLENPLGREEQIRQRSEERRVGKECGGHSRSRWSPTH